MTPALLDRADLRQRVGAALTAFLAHQRALCASIDPSLLPVPEAIEGFVLGGGKRLRPAFAYWGYRGAGGVDRDEVISAVSALELLQASALIHDDLIDGSDTRRGEPSVHRAFARRHSCEGWNGSAEAFGAASAILLGDLCLAWSDELLHRCGLTATELHRMRPMFDQMRSEVLLGQYLDVQTQAAGHTSTARASLIAQYKSAKYTVERPLLLGAAMADAGPGVTAAYSAFGLPLGEAFQLRDDVLGVFGDPEVTGKPAGDDLREGKRTYLVAAALDAADSSDRELLERGLGDPRLDQDRVGRIRKIIITTGALERTESRIESLHRTAVAALDQAHLPAEAREVLVGLAGAAVRRAL